MSMSSIPSSSQSGKLYGWVERIGNKVPHPFLLFIYLIIVLMVTTAILSAFGVSAKNPTDGTPVVVKNLLSVEGLHWFLPNVIKNFSGFAPLGAILALVLGAGLAERVGLLPALMVKMASHVNARYASYMVLFIAFFSHISSDAALVIMPPMGALIFLAVGRHPVAGLLAAIAGVGCGFTANLLIVTTDVLLSGISTEAAAAFNPQMHVSVIDNWYFMASIRIAFSAGISFCPTVSWIPATLQTRRETGYLLFVSLALSAYLFGGMAADVAGVVSCWSADRSGDLPTFVLRENGC